MTELWIDGVAVVLPTNMSVTVKRENPFFTKNGEYTYELNIDLSNSTNASLYKHLNRYNSIVEIKEKRTAILIADNRMYCNGTEIIIGWTEQKVKIQIASGNSELNYLIGGDLMISFLEMPTTSPLDPVYPNKRWIEKLYPDIDFCLSPILNRTSGIMMNEWTLNWNATELKYELGLKPDYQTTNFIPQPFLCAYIKNVLGGIGYTLTSNALEETVWKDLYICHINRTNEWGKMLPGWSVKDFIEEVEKLFNASLIIDNRQRTAMLVLNQVYYLNSKTTHVQSIIDQHEIECEDEEQKLHQQSNIKYSFPDNSYYRHRCLPVSIINKAKKAIKDKEVPLFFYFLEPEHKNTNILVTDEFDGAEYIYEREIYYGWAVGPIYKLVNEFKSLERKEASNTIDLEMIPVELKELEWPTPVSGMPANEKSYLYMFPVMDEKDNDTTTEDIDDLSTQIENAVSDSGEITKGKICLAFHQGLNNSHPNNMTGIFPMPFTDETIRGGLGEIWNTNSKGATLKLANMNDYFYSGAYEIDKKHPIKIKSYDANVYDTRGIFEINNKRYVCKETEYVLTTDGRKKAWNGVFYPIRINDTEAYQRWILTDGKWRDGGVWLDNGRWLDE